MSEYDLPILIYFAKEGCPACIQYESEWKKVIQQLKEKGRFIKFNCSSTLPPPPSLSPYVDAFPTIMLAAPRSYFKCFTPNDQINYEECTNGYTIKGIKMNPDRGLNSNKTVEWFHENVPSILRMNEPLPSYNNF
jgi:hypothetical protein